MMMVSSELKGELASNIELQRQVIGHLKLLAEACRRVASKKSVHARAKDKSTAQMVHCLSTPFLQCTGKRFKKTLDIDYE